MARLEIEIGGSDRGGNAELQETLGLLEQLNQLKRGLTLDLFKAESVEQIRQVGEELTTVNIGIGKYLNLASRATQAWQDDRTATILDNLATKVAVAQANTSTFGETIRTQTAELRAYQSAFDQLIANGVDRVSTEVMAVDTKIKTLTASINEQKSALARQTAYDNLQTKLKQISADMRLVGDTSGTATAQTRAYQTAINALIKSGIDPANQEVKQLQATIQQLNAQIAQSKAAELGEQFQRTGSLIRDAENRVAALKKTATFATNEQSLASLNKEVVQAQKELDRLKNVGLDAHQVMRRFGQQTNSVGIEFSRVVQDLPYASRAFGAMQDNFGAIGNNITRMAELWPIYINNVRAAMIANGQAATSFAVLRASMVGMVTGFNGIILAISLLTSAFTIWQTLSARRARELEKEKQKVKTLAEQVDRLISVMDAENRLRANAVAGYAKELSMLDSLYGTVMDVTIAKDQQARAYEELQRLYPAEFGSLSMLEVQADKTGAAYERLVANMRKAAYANAANELGAKAMEDQVKALAATTTLSKKLEEARNRLTLSEIRGRKEIEKYGAAYANEVVVRNKRIQKEIRALEDELRITGEAVATASKEYDVFSAAAIKANGAVEEQTGLIHDLEKRMSQLQAARPFLKTEEELRANAKATQELQKELDRLGGKKVRLDTKKAERDIKNLGGAISDIYNPSTDSGNLIGLEALEKANQATQNKYQKLLDSVNKMEREKTDYYLNELKRKPKLAAQINSELAKITRDAVNERAEIEVGRSREIEANKAKFAEESASKIAEYEARAGKSRIRSREQEIAADRSYWDAVERNAEKYNISIAQLTEWRKASEAAINEKWDQQMIQSSFIYQRRENDSLEQMLIRSLNKRTEIELSQLRGDNQKKLELQKRYFEQLRAIQERAATIDFVAGFDGSAFTLMYEEMETRAMLLRGQVDANIISLRQYAQEMANLAAKTQVLDVIRGEFSSLSQGIGDSLAEAAIEGENALEALEATFKSVAKSIISELIQIGARYLINQVIGTSAMAATAATSAAAAKTVATSWSTAAALVAAATFGASAAAGGTALGALIASTKAMAIGFYSGGYTGNVGRRKVAGVVHGQEFVMNAVATRENRPILEAMNSGLDYTRHLPRKAGNVNYGSIRESQAPAQTVVVRGDIQNGVIRLSNERASRFNRKFGRE